MKRAKRAPPQAMPCSIPGCCNLLQEWTTEFPRDEELQDRWKAAIQVGTGQCPADDSVRNGAQVCDMHFSVEQRSGSRNEYLEPSLFVRDKVLLQVTCCRLCLRYDTIDTMFDKEHCLAQGQTLQRLVNKYYKIAPSGNEAEEAGFFCESCTIRIDMTHAFWHELNEGAKESRKLLKKMQKEKPVFISPTPGAIQIKQELLLTDDVQLVGGIEDVLVKEEPQLEELDPRHLVGASGFDYVTPLFDGQEESTDGSQDGQALAENNAPTLFRCYICSINLETKQTLIQHLVAGHPAEQTYRCKECNLSFNQITGYNIHLSKHDNRRPFKCTICSVRFNRDMARKFHEASKHAIDHGKLSERDRVRKRQMCATCGRTCASKVALTRHELIQHGIGSETVQQNDYKCEICSKSFATVRNLERHLKIHRNEKPFKCEQCDASFRRNDQLRIHERLHTGEKPLVCPGCGEGFAASFSLFRHKKQCPAMQVKVPDAPVDQE